MDHAEHVAAVDRELRGLTAAVAVGPESAEVPTCPGWDVRALAEHVGSFTAFWAHVLCEGTDRPKPVVPDAPRDGDLAGWLAERGGDLMTELRATPPATPVWSWYEPDQTAGFVARRCAHELAIHRYDAESARSTPGAIEVSTAADGIDELVSVLVSARPRTGQGSGRTLHLHGTDPGVKAEWLVTLHPDRVDVRREHAKGDLALRGAASDLELVLYGRPPLGAIERFGDSSVLDEWYREFSF